MNFCFLYDCVIVKCLDQEIKIVLGIVIFDVVVEKLDQGEVLVIGLGKCDDKGVLIVFDVKVGDCVLFGKYVGQIVKVDGQELLVMCEEDIMVVVNVK